VFAGPGVKSEPGAIGDRVSTMHTVRGRSEDPVASAPGTDLTCGTVIYRANLSAGIRMEPLKMGAQESALLTNTCDYLLNL